MDCNNKPIPKVDRNDYICPKCGINCHHINIDLKIRKIQPSGQLVILYLYELKTDSNNFISISAKDINNDIWKKIFINDKTKFANYDLSNSGKESCIQIRIKTCSNCGNRLIWESDTNNDISCLANQSITNFEIDEPNKYMPNDLKPIYNEAKSISKLSPRSASALLRHLLEQLILKKFPEFKNKKLNEMLNDQKFISTIGTKLKEVSYSIKQLGNNSIHKLEIDINELSNNISRLFDWINDVSGVLFKDYEQISNDAKELENKVI